MTYRRVNDDFYSIGEYGMVPTKDIVKTAIKSLQLNAKKKRKRQKKKK
jgi:hypothetical protein